MRGIEMLIQEAKLLAAAMESSQAASATRGDETDGVRAQASRELQAIVDARCERRDVPALIAGTQEELPFNKLLEAAEDARIAKDKRLAITLIGRIFALLDGNATTLKTPVE